jgi:hypothetical protein
VWFYFLLGGGQYTKFSQEPHNTVAAFVSHVKDYMLMCQVGYRFWLRFPLQSKDPHKCILGFLHLAELTLIWRAVKKFIALRLGLPVRAPLPPTTLLLVAWESDMTPSLSEYIKTLQQTGGSFYILIGKLPKTAFFDKKI